MKPTLTCNICNKVFQTRFNYNRHLSRHTDVNQHQCNKCGKVFARRDNFVRHLQNKHSSDNNAQSGYGADQIDEPTTKRQKLSENGRDFYQVTDMTEVDMKKFKTKGIQYTIKFNDNLDIRDPTTILSTLHKVFQNLIDNFTDGAHPDDLIRMVVECPELDYPIQLPLMKKRHLTAERFLAKVERVLQSYEEFSIDGTLEIHITHVQMPRGGKIPKKRYVDLERFLKEKKCILRIQNKDELCCARAIVTAKAQIEKPNNWDAIRKGCKIQQQLAMDLHQSAGVPIAKCGINEIKQFQNALPKFQIIIASLDYGNAIIYKGPPAKQQIYLYHHNNHYDIITSMPAFLNRSYFCIECMKGYNNKIEHRCQNTCKLCFQSNCVEEEWVYCDDCNRSFKSEVCYKNHLKHLSTSVGSVCNQYYRCRDCDKFISKNRHKGKPHQCGEKYCTVCKTFVQQDHLCYMQPVIHETEVDKNDRSDNEGMTIVSPSYIFFDFECIQETGIHEPNLCIAQKVCNACINIDEDANCLKCGEREKEFQGSNTRQDFCKWLFNEENAGAIVICHNFKGYDSYFVLRYLYDNAILPEVIYNGAKVMSINVSANDMKFIDSLNFLPMALSKLPGAFGLNELAKGYFPHLFNTKANQEIVLPHLPDIHYYNPDGMSTIERKAFVEWYNKHRNNEFNCKLELIKYCRSDVDILRRCCLQFRSLFMKITEDESSSGIDPFQKCITIASACNLVYRTKYLLPDTIGIIHPLGYSSNDIQSTKALQWLKWLSHQKGQYIQHAANQGEKRIGNYKADGYFEADGEEIVLEFHGCLHHGHTCMTRETKHPLNSFTMEELYQKTLDKRRYITGLGYKYIEQWECEFDKEIKQNNEMAEFVKSLTIPLPLVPRDAFFGGRTNAAKLYYSVQPNEKIKYVDFTSLYPYINKVGIYPIGHPIIITEDFKDISEYEGLIKCKVLPPRGLYHPVLPYRASGRLMFPLCSKCCESLIQSPCDHNDDDRALVGTWVTPELTKALQKGYKLLQIHEVWHFENTSVYDPVTKDGGLFAPYVNAFLKLKQEASDWPSWCKTKEQQDKYIQLYFEKEGIMLNPQNIKKNPGLRALAKLMLNSFWGKFGQRPNMTKTTYVNDPEEYFEMMTRDYTEVQNVNFVNDQMVEVQWQQTQDFVEPSGRTNVIIAAYTSAQARLKLYELLEALGRRVLYYDTDSVIYVSKEGQWEPPIGDFLGELTDELESDNHVVTFVSGGPKNYSYKLARPDKNGNLTHCKVRGIRLNYRNNFLVNFESMSKMVQGMGPKEIQVTDPYKIVRKKKNMNIETREEKKIYQVVYTKRVPIENYDTVPYGY